MVFNMLQPHRCLKHAGVQGGQSLSDAPQTYALEIFCIVENTKRLSSQQTEFPIGELTTFGSVSADEVFHLEA